MPSKKTGFVQRLFSEVPAIYELINHILMLEFDIIWRRQAARIAVMTDGDQWNGIYTDTGEMAAYLSRPVPKGTRIYDIDFSPHIKKFFDLYIKLFVELIGGRISGSRTAYACLAKTIPRFYSAEELAGIMCQAGFEKVTFQQLLFGVAAIHQGTKL